MSARKGKAPAVAEMLAKAVLAKRPKRAKPPEPAQVLGEVLGRVDAARLERINSLPIAERAAAQQDELFKTYYGTSVKHALQVQESMVQLASNPDNGMVAVAASGSLNDWRRTDLQAYKYLVESQAAMRTALAAEGQRAAAQLNPDELALLVLEHVDRDEGQGAVEPLAGSVAEPAGPAAGGAGDAAGPALGQAVGDDARGGPVAAASAGGPGLKLAALR